MKKNSLYLLYVILLSLIPKMTMATIGGPQEIEILGYDPNDKNIYFFYHYYDESGCPPDFLEYDIEAKTLRIYPGCARQGNYNDINISSINSKLIKIPSSTRYSDQAFSFKRLSPKTKRDKYYNYDFNVFPLEITIGERKFIIEQCFEKDSIPKIVGQHEIPDQDFGFVIIRYFGLCYESGYNNDTIIFFPAVERTLQNLTSDKFIVESPESRQNLTDTTIIDKEPDINKFEEKEILPIKKNPELNYKDEQINDKKNWIWLTFGLIFIIIATLLYKKRKK